MSNKHHTPSNTNTNTQNVARDIKGELSYDNKVVQKIIGLALEQVDGLLAIDGGFFSNLADKIVNGTQEDKEKYLNYLKAGNSDYPLNVIKKAGVDMEKEDYLNATFAVFERRLDEFEALVEKLGLA